MSSPALPLAAELRLQLLATACNRPAPAVQQAPNCSKGFLYRPEARPDRLSISQRAQGANKSDKSRTEASQQRLHQIQEQLHHRQPHMPLPQMQSGTAKTMDAMGAVKTVQAVKTAYTHFSDEGELSDMDGEVASAQAASAKRQKTDAGVKVLYHGPSSDQLAAAAAAAMAPAGPRPLLGDVLSEVIHVQDVKRSACATGVPDEPLKEEDWRCIMRHKNAVGCELDHNVNGGLRSSVNGFYMPKTACRRSRHCLEATVWYHVEKACRACWLFDADAQHALTAITACTLCGGL